ncbi:MAG: adenylate/guanylate cyclase domain-containing protein [Alphaproteobacteria bacterium]|nr:adenylate/guanylate cyclase domain-containing protein [Alphaproteobacteria bacterium]MCB9930779.1 adenylate/guanylate cyclase domain-containing protein [Alphaproteobacteria bacterium]
MSEEGLRHTIADWIMEAALGGTDMSQLVEGTANHLLGIGVPLARTHVTFRTLHPAFESVSLIWRRGQSVSAQEFVHGLGTTDSWKRSPFAYMIEHKLRQVRRPLVGDSALLDFPVLEDLLAEGFTDYFAMVIPFDTNGQGLLGNRPDGIATSWVTDRVGGFSDSHIGALQNAVPRLAVVCKLVIREQISRNVADTYLGKSAGRQVLGGHIRLGDYETFDAVAWFADLRDSTGRIERLGIKRYLALLNGFLECTAGAAMAHGGEILAYPGDGVLAIFHDPDPTVAADTALTAAAEARRRLHDVNANLSALGQETLECGLALHRGELAFGNIGTGGRQAFTVIGPTINVVNRLEEMSKHVPCPVLLSGAVAEWLPESALQLEPLGSHHIRGSEHPLAVFGARDNVLLPYKAPPGYTETVLPSAAALLTPA